MLLTYGNVNLGTKLKIYFMKILQNFRNYLIPIWFEMITYHLLRISMVENFWWSFSDIVQHE